MANEVKCPRCGSTQLSANKKGFSGTKAVGGAILTGGIGLLAGTIGSNKIIITCLACGHEFKPGDYKEKEQVEYVAKLGREKDGTLITDEAAKQKALKFLIITAIVIVVFSIILFKACN